MNLLSLYLFALIAAPIESPVPRLPEQLRPLLHGVAVQVEIYSLAESEHSYRGQASAHDDVRYLRYWYTILRDCPQLADGAWLPCHQDAEQTLKFIRARRCHALEQLAWLEYDRGLWGWRAESTGYLADLRATRRWTGEQDAIWSAVVESNSITACWYTRRSALKRLRNLIGAEAFAAGRLPFPE